MFFSGKYIIDEDTFQIQFLGKSIRNKASSVLSDGEKSIVAFCLYLAETHKVVNNEDDYIFCGYIDKVTAEPYTSRRGIFIKIHAFSYSKNNSRL